MEYDIKSLVASSKPSASIKYELDAKTVTEHDWIQLGRTTQLEDSSTTYYISTLYSSKSAEFPENNALFFTIQTNVSILTGTKTVEVTYCSVPSMRFGFTYDEKGFFYMYRHVGATIDSVAGKIEPTGYMHGPLQVNVQPSVIRDDTSYEFSDPIEVNESLECTYISSAVAGSTISVRSDTKPSEIISAINAERSIYVCECPSAGWPDIKIGADINTVTITFIGDVQLLREEDGVFGATGVISDIEDSVTERNIIFTIRNAKSNPVFRCLRTERYDGDDFEHYTHKDIGGVSIDNSYFHNCDNLGALSISGTMNNVELSNCSIYSVPVPETNYGSAITGIFQALHGKSGFSEWYDAGADAKTSPKHAANNFSFNGLVIRDTQKLYMNSGGSPMYDTSGIPIYMSLEGITSPADYDAPGILSINGGEIGSNNGLIREISLNCGHSYGDTTAGGGDTGGNGGTDGGGTWNYIEDVIAEGSHIVSADFRFNISGIDLTNLVIDRYPITVREATYDTLTKSHIVRTAEQQGLKGAKIKDGYIKKIYHPALSPHTYMALDGDCINMLCGCKEPMSSGMQFYPNHAGAVCRIDGQGQSYRLNASYTPNQFLKIDGGGSGGQYPPVYRVESENDKEYYDCPDYQSIELSNMDVDCGYVPFMVISPTAKFGISNTYDQDHDGKGANGLHWPTQVVIRNAKISCGEFITLDRVNINGEGEAVFDSAIDNLILENVEIDFNHSSTPNLWLNPSTYFAEHFRNIYFNNVTLRIHGDIFRIYDNERIVKDVTIPEDPTPDDGVKPEPIVTERKVYGHADIRNLKIIENYTQGVTPPEDISFFSLKDEFGKYFTKVNIRDIEFSLDWRGHSDNTGRLIQTENVIANISDIKFRSGKVENILYDSTPADAKIHKNHVIVRSAHIDSGATIDTAFKALNPKTVSVSGFGFDDGVDIKSAAENVTLSESRETMYDALYLHDRPSNNNYLMGIPPATNQLYGKVVGGHDIDIQMGSMYVHGATGPFKVKGTGIVEKYYSGDAELFLPAEYAGDAGGKGYVDTLLDSNVRSVFRIENGDKLPDINRKARPIMEVAYGVIPDKSNSGFDELNPEDTSKMNTKRIILNSDVVVVGKLSLENDKNGIQSTSSTNEKLYVNKYTVVPSSDGISPSTYTSTMTYITPDFIRMYYSDKVTVSDISFGGSLVGAAGSVDINRKSTSYFSLGLFVQSPYRSGFSSSSDDNTALTVYGRTYLGRDNAQIPQDKLLNAEVYTFVGNQTVFYDKTDLRPREVNGKLDYNQIDNASVYFCGAVDMEKDLNVHGKIYVDDIYLNNIYQKGDSYVVDTDTLRLKDSTILLRAAYDSKDNLVPDVSGAPTLLSGMVANVNGKGYTHVEGSSFQIKPGIAIDGNGIAYVGDFKYITSGEDNGAITHVSAADGNYIPAAPIATRLPDNALTGNGIVLWDATVQSLKTANIDVTENNNGTEVTIGACNTHCNNIRIGRNLHALNYDIQSNILYGENMLHTSSATEENIVSNMLRLRSLIHLYDGSAVSSSVRKGAILDGESYVYGDLSLMRAPLSGITEPCSLFTDKIQPVTSQIDIVSPKVVLDGTTYLNNFVEVKGNASGGGSICFDNTTFSVLASVNNITSPNKAYKDVVTFKFDTDTRRTTLRFTDTIACTTSLSSGVIDLIDRFMVKGVTGSIYANTIKVNNARTVYGPIKGAIESATIAGIFASCTEGVPDTDRDAPAHISLMHSGDSGHSLYLLEHKSVFIWSNATLNFSNLQQSSNRPGARKTATDTVPFANAKSLYGNYYYEINVHGKGDLPTVRCQYRNNAANAWTPYETNVFIGDVSYVSPRPANVDAMVRVFVSKDFGSFRVIIE